MPKRRKPSSNEKVAVNNLVFDTFLGRAAFAVFALPGVLIFFACMAVDEDKGDW